MCGSGEGRERGWTSRGAVCKGGEGAGGRMRDEEGCVSRGRLRHSTCATARERRRESGGVLDANCVKSFGDEVAIRRYCVGVRVAHSQGNARSNVWPRLSRESWHRHTTHDARDKLTSGVT